MAVFVYYPCDVEWKELVYLTGAISNVKENLLGAVSRQRRQRSPTSLPMKALPSTHAYPHISTTKTVSSKQSAQPFVHAQSGLSPIASVSSSTSCIPKSSSSTGPISRHSPVEYDISQLDRSTGQGLLDIDCKLASLHTWVVTFITNFLLYYHDPWMIICD